MLRKIRALLPVRVARRVLRGILKEVGKKYLEINAPELEAKMNQKIGEINARLDAAYTDEKLEVFRNWLRKELKGARRSIAGLKIEIKDSLVNVVAEIAVYLWKVEEEFEDPQ